MSSTEPDEQIFYNSIYRHGVDDKRRVQIPAKWRPKVPDIKLTLILWRNGAQQEPCLLALPPHLAQAMTAKLMGMPFGDPKAESLRRLLGVNSDRVTMDSAGRICLPEVLADAAGITKEAVMVGMFDRFQIWAPERYAATAVVDQALSGEAYNLI